MKHQPYDLIGDIHGQYDKLAALLKVLGYHAKGSGFHHNEGRQVIFLGDYIDRGPKSRDVLRTVRAMVDAGDALAIMGNHEYNAIAYHTPDGNGGWLRPREWDRYSGNDATLNQFHGREAEWAEWLAWMRHLPLFLDLGDVRAVHASWDAAHVQWLAGKTLADDAFLIESASHNSPAYRAVDHVLKGPELKVPSGGIYTDDGGRERPKVRVRWWDVPAAASLSEMSLPPGANVTGDADAGELARLPNYGRGEPPIFFGHYWLPADHAKAPLRHNIACMDFSAARRGPLVAYRWNGERALRAANFVAAPESFNHSPSARTNRRELAVF